MGSSASQGRGGSSIPRPTSSRAARITRAKHLVQGAALCGVAMPARSMGSAGAFRVSSSARPRLSSPQHRAPNAVARHAALLESRLRCPHRRTLLHSFPRTVKCQKGAFAKFLGASPARICPTNPHTAVGRAVTRYRALDAPQRVTARWKRRNASQRVGRAATRHSALDVPQRVTARWTRRNALDAPQRVTARWTRRNASQRVGRAATRYSALDAPQRVTAR